MKKLAIIFLLLSFSACKDNQDDCPTPANWLDAMINIGSDSHGKFTSVYSYKYKGNTVYLINYEVKCCDFFTSQLFDSKGNSLCFPYGGITGNGDKKCEDFDLNKTNEKLYWGKP